MQQKVSWIRTAALSGLAFGVPMGFILGAMLHSVEAGVVTAVLGGVMFGYFMGSFGRAASETSTFAQGGRDAGFDPDETVLFSGPANHFKGMEGVGGKLYLTTQRLRFRSHALNVQNHDESYPLTSIAGVQPVSTLGLIPNGLLVYLSDDRRERFVVHQRKEWVSRIRRAVASPPRGRSRKAE